MTKGGDRITVALVVMVGLPLFAVLVWALSFIPNMPTWVKFCLVTPVAGGLGLWVGYSAGSDSGTDYGHRDLPRAERRSRREAPDRQVTYLPPMPESERRRLQASYPDVDPQEMWEYLHQWKK